MCPRHTTTTYKSVASPEQIELDMLANFSLAGVLICSSILAIAFIAWLIYSQLKFEVWFAQFNEETNKGDRS